MKSCSVLMLVTLDNALSRWSSNYLEALHPFKNPRAPLQLDNWMKSAGFTEVESRLLTLPMCGWSRGADWIRRRLSIELS